MEGSEAVCDAGPLIHLSEIGRADILGQFHPLLVPERVWQEALSFTRPAGLRLEIVSISDSEREDVSRKVPAKLDAGELEGLALCLKKPGAIFLTDDLPARKEAARIGISAWLGGSARAGIPSRVAHGARSR